MVLMVLVVLDYVLLSPTFGWTGAACCALSCVVCMHDGYGAQFGDV
jgi:hypothetical protein